MPDVVKYVPYDANKVGFILCIIAIVVLHYFWYEYFIPYFYKGDDIDD